MVCGAERVGVVPGDAFKAQPMKLTVPLLGGFECALVQDALLVRLELSLGGAAARTSWLLLSATTPSTTNTSNRTSTAACCSLTFCVICRNARKSILLPLLTN
jgi:hypothetical protein